MLHTNMGAIFYQKQEFSFNRARMSERHNVSAFLGMKKLSDCFETSSKSKIPSSPPSVLID